MAKYEMKIDLNVINHLGINLYSNIPAVLSEVVANSWDADAENVRINIDLEKKEIIIEDDGIGMSLEDINKKYLIIGYSKRKNGESKSPNKKRDVMGRKGIGKLSLFSIANEVEIYSSNGTDINGLKMTVEKIKKQIIENNGNYFPDDIDVSEIILEKGTRIILKDLKKNILQAESHLKRRLSRRFSVIGEKNDFEVYVNDNSIKIEDRDYFHKIEYLWYYGDESKIYSESSTKAKQIERRDNILDGGHVISGWLGLVENSSDLVDGAENLNKITVLMRGKLAKEDILGDFREGGLFAKYLFGEINADFLDIDNQEDIATSSRQSIVEDDPRYQSLKEFIWNEIKYIQRQREHFKREEGTEQAIKYKPIEEWYSTLKGDTKKKAKSLFGKINSIAVDEKHRKELYSHGVLAFESFRYKDALDSLDEINDENLDSFLKVFKEFDEIEATLYYKITQERLEIIKKLQDKVETEDALEKLLQQFLFKHLWLLDPSWDRATAHAEMEKTVSNAFDKITSNLTNEEKRGRVDIVYKKPSGKHVIIELKRASVKCRATDLISQVEKYQNALEKILRESGETNFHIESICVVGKPLHNWEEISKEESDRNMMKTKNIRVVTYKQLINDSYNSYKEYLDKNDETNDIMSLIKSIEDSIFDDDENHLV